MSDAVYGTWQDFAKFYENDFIKEIAVKEKWTVSDKDKCPIDMHALIHDDKVWGLSFNRGYNPLVDLKTLCEVLPNAANNAYFLDAIEDKFVILDVEPKCPDILKENFKKLPYLYGEVSMSGNGLHLVFKLPEDILAKYPIAQKKLALKEEHGYYEILLNHMVTFTRRLLPETEPTQDEDAFRTMFEILAMKAVETKSADSQIEIENINTDDIPYYNTLMTTLNAQKYGKTPEDFYNDMSKYEYGMAGFYYNTINRLLNKKRTYKDHIYTDDEIAIMIYELLVANLPYRAKHDEQRSNMPWLLYTATNLVARNN